MENILVELLQDVGNIALLSVIALVVYWVMEWIKRVLPLTAEWKQPVAYLVGTIISAGIMFNYDFRPLPLGEPKYVIMEYFIQGLVVAALSGFLYSQFFEKTKAVFIHSTPITTVQNNPKV